MPIRISPSDTSTGGEIRWRGGTRKADFPRQNDCTNTHTEQQHSRSTSASHVQDEPLSHGCLVVSTYPWALCRDLMSFLTLHISTCLSASLSPPPEDMIDLACREQAQVESRQGLGLDSVASDPHSSVGDFQRAATVNGINLTPHPIYCSSRTTLSLRNGSSLVRGKASTPHTHPVAFSQSCHRTQCLLRISMYWCHYCDPNDTQS